MLEKFRGWKRRRTYRAGEICTKFVARDVFREVQVIDVSDIDIGIILGRVRTWNVLHQSKGFKEKPPFGDVERLELHSLWDWAGKPWVGPVPASSGEDI